MRAVLWHIACGVVLPLGVLDCAAPPRSAHPPSATKPDRAQAESLCAAGLTLLEDSRYSEAEEAFKSAVDQAHPFQFAGHLISSPAHQGVSP